MIQKTTKFSLALLTLLISTTLSFADECTNDPNECTPKKLCGVATAPDGSKTIWSTAAGSTKHVKLAQNLGMECGVTPVVDMCDADPKECKISELCDKATIENAGQKSWDNNARKYVVLAKEYGLKCDVNEAIASKSPVRNFKQSFLSENKLKRQQIQYALKGLGYYAFGIDGAWGKGTSLGLDKFVKASNLHDKNENKVFETLLSKVNVPYSFESKSKKQTVSASKRKINGNKSYDCKRTNTPTIGFTNVQAANSWYPLEIWIAIAADKSWMGSTWGHDRKRTAGEKNRNRLSINRKSNIIITVDGKSLRDDKRSTIYVSISNTSGNYQPLGNARYDCSKAKATSWKP